MKLTEKPHKFHAHKGANIALIKYMGKGPNNTSLNPTLSLYLPNCHTTVKLIWQPKKSSDTFVYNSKNQQEITTSQKNRFLKHLKTIRTHYDFHQGGFSIESTNNFPMGTGIASSASSFAALTQAACDAIEYLTNSDSHQTSTKQKAALSRLGSGSSCRSFFQPWSIWEGAETRGINLPLADLIHWVVVTHASPKKVSSSTAHQRVTTSPKFKQHLQQTKIRYAQLLTAINTQNWQQIHQIVNTEWQAMHQLFNTCAQPFSYINSDTQKVINWVESCWKSTTDGPLITLDAGPNVHLLFRNNQPKILSAFIQNFSSKYLLISGTHQHLKTKI